MTLRVLHVIPSFGSGGAERQVVLLAGALAKLGVNVDIAFVHAGSNFEAASKCGAKLHRLSVAGNHDPRTLIDLLALIRRLRPDLLQTWLLHADVFGGTAAKLARVPWLLSERCSAAMYSSGFKNRLRRAIGKSASAIVANSESGLEYWRASGFGGLGRVIRNIVDDTALESNRGSELRESTVSGAPLILCVGRLTAQKNWPATFVALEYVLARLPNARAVVLGDGPLMTSLQERASRSAILAGRVSLPGFVDDVACWYRRADVFLSLSHYEGTPNTVLEAMLHQCPVVVSDIPEHREFVTSGTGWFAPRGDPAAAGTVVCQVLADPSAARDRARMARQAIGAWTPTAIAHAYIDLYARLTGGRSIS